MTDSQICDAFAQAEDLIRRELRCGEFTLYAYAIDGLVNGADAARLIFRPIAEDLRGDAMEALFRKALSGTIYNTVASACESLTDVSSKLVNGFCVVLFPGVGAIAYEVRTGVGRTPSAPELENTVKGPKDAFVETLRINTSLVRRHLRTPELGLWQTDVFNKSEHPKPFTTSLKTPSLPTSLERAIFSPG